MLPAIITTFLWSYCVIAAKRSVHQLGENQANFARIALAVFCLGAVAHIFGLGLGGGGFTYFLLSGIVGFGLGDIGIFYALPRIGSRLTILMAQCLAAPIAGLGEWYWMGTSIGLIQIISIGVILFGVCIALLPKSVPSNGWKSFTIGICFGLTAAFGQAFGAIISRKAYEVAYGSQKWPASESTFEHLVLGATAGYQRLIGGFIIISIFFLISLYYRPWKTRPHGEGANDKARKKVLFVVLTAMSGPVIGIMCFQWALSTTQSGIVQAIVATTPLVVIPMAYVFEGDVPPKRAFIGAIVSIFGVLGLAFL